MFSFQLNGPEANVVGCSTNFCMLLPKAKRPIPKNLLNMSTRVLSDFV